MDKLRLVMPPTLFCLLAIPFWQLKKALFFWHWHAGTAIFCGGIFGYICYDLTHYFLHHKTYVLLPLRDVRNLSTDISIEGSPRIGEN